MVGKLSSFITFHRVRDLHPGCGPGRGAQQGLQASGRGLARREAALSRPEWAPPVLPPAASSPYLTPPGAPATPQPQAHTLQSRPRRSPGTQGWWGSTEPSHPSLASSSKRALGNESRASQDHERDTARRKPRAVPDRKRPARLLPTSHQASVSGLGPPEPGLPGHGAGLQQKPQWCRRARG